MVYSSNGENALNRQDWPRELWRGIRNAVLMTVPVWLLFYWALGTLLR
jgi:hypothetical protein